MLGLKLIYVDKRRPRTTLGQACYSPIDTEAWLKEYVKYKMWINQDTPWISKYIHHVMWDDIIYPFPYFSCATVETWEWVCNFIPYLLDTWLRAAMHQSNIPQCIFLLTNVNTYIGLVRCGISGASLFCSVINILFIRVSPQFISFGTVWTSG